MIILYHHGQWPLDENTFTATYGFHSGNITNQVILESGNKSYVSKCCLMTRETEVLMNDNLSILY